tara:strand:- start:367 stop:471 length:105 start_codon:yes stop_codon:yes gene_type:complete
MHALNVRKEMDSYGIGVTLVIAKGIVSVRVAEQN